MTRELSEGFDRLNQTSLVDMTERNPLVNLEDLKSFPSPSRNSNEKMVEDLGLPEGSLLVADLSDYNPFKKVSDAMDQAAKPSRPFETVRGGESVAAKDGWWRCPTVKINIDGKEREIDMNLPGLPEGSDRVRLETNGTQLRATDWRSGKQWMLDATKYPWGYSFEWKKASK
ncbi:MAG TPA: hypothetical protein V6D08_05275 [Candidatus Obscuribacterales bacterium]